MYDGLQRVMAKDMMKKKNNVFLILFGVAIVCCCLAVSLEAHAAGEGLEAALASLHKEQQTTQTENMPLKTHGGAKKGKQGKTALKKFCPQSIGIKPKPTQANKKTTEKRNTVSQSKKYRDIHEERAALLQGNVIVSRELSRENDMFLRHKGGLPGGKDTLSQMDGTEHPEFSLKYKLDSKTAARLTVNQQDDTSPLYSPLDDRQMVGATGMFLDYDLKKNVQVQMGAEYRSYGKAPLDEEETTSQGASIGMKWSF